MWNQTGMTLTNDSDAAVLRAIETMRSDDFVQSVTIRVRGGFSLGSIAVGDIINVKVNVNRHGVVSLA